MEQGALADAIGAARNTIGNYEAGRTSPKPYILAQWALITGVPLEWLRGTDSREGGPQVTHEKVAVRRVGNVLYPTFGGRRVVEHEHLAPVIHLADRRLAVAA